jgi:peptidoglycan/LPS O-acetylase OafA/YrhL
VVEAAPASSAKHFHRNEKLDAWRGLSMVMIFTLHTAAATALSIQDSNPALAFALRKFGFITILGLQYFFVFSGCLITRILLDAKGKQHYYRNYYIRRILRIFPLYYAFLFVCLVVGPAIFGRHRFLHDFLDIGYKPTCMWFLGTNIWQCLYHSWCFGALTHLWSLAVEEHFYLVWPLVVAALPCRHLVRLCTVLILVSTVTRLLVWFVWHDPIGLRVNTLCNMDCFAAGAICAVLTYTQSEQRCMRIANKLLIAGAAIVPFYIYMSAKHQWFSGVFVSSAAAVVCSGIIMKTLCDANSCKLFGQQLLKHLGKYCYGLYVLHYPVIHLVALFLVPKSWPAAAIFASIFFISWAIVIPIAMLSYHYFEMPFLKLKERFEFASAAPAKQAL